MAKKLTKAQRELLVTLSIEDRIKSLRALYRQANSVPFRYLPREYKLTHWIDREIVRYSRRLAGVTVPAALPKARRTNWTRKYLGGETQSSPIGAKPATVEVPEQFKPVYKLSPETSRKALYDLCDMCDGSGGNFDKTCPVCNGEKYIKVGLTLGQVNRALNDLAAANERIGELLNIIDTAAEGCNSVYVRLTKHADDTDTNPLADLDEIASYLTAAIL